MTGAGDDAERSDEEERRNGLCALQRGPRVRTT
jgi:hypothetical protein